MKEVAETYVSQPLSPCKATATRNIHMSYKEKTKRIHISKVISHERTT
jgi:hypothetical protein